MSGARRSRALDTTACAVRDHRGPRGELLGGPNRVGATGRCPSPLEYPMDNGQ